MSATLRRFAVLVPLLALPYADVMTAQEVATPRTILIVVDDLHLDFRHTPQLRTLVGQLLRSFVRGIDRADIITTGASASLPTQTRDAPTREAAVARLVGTALRPTDIFATPQASGPSDETAHRALITFTTTARALDALAADPGPAPVHVLFVSTGFLVGETPEREALIAAARRVSATLHTIDPRAFSDPTRPAQVTAAAWEAYLTTTRESLRHMAGETGGMAVFTMDDLAALQKRVAATAG